MDKQAQGRVSASCNIWLSQALGIRQHRVLANEATEENLRLERDRVAEIERYRPLIGSGGTLASIWSGEFNRGAFDMGQSAGMADRFDAIEEVVERIIREGPASAGRLSEHSVPSAS